LLNKQAKFKSYEVEGRRQSDNVEDRRGMSSGGKTLAGGGIVGLIILLINVLEVKMSKC
jgi:predicted metalloprotease